jgi:acyl carrier protein
MMKTTDIEREVRSFLVDNFLFGRAEELCDDELLLGNVIESTGVLELVTFLQEHFLITVRDEEVVADNVGSVRNIVAYVTRKLNSKS